MLNNMINVINGMTNTINGLTYIVLCFDSFLIGAEIGYFVVDFFGRIW